MVCRASLMYSTVLFFLKNRQPPEEAGENGRVSAVLPLMLLPPAIDPGPAV